MKIVESVHVDLRQLGHLARRLRQVAGALDETADRLFLSTGGVGVGSGPRRRLREAAAWAHDQHRALRGLLVELRRLDEAGARPFGLSLSSRRHAAFADPVAAHAAATEAIGLLTSGSDADHRRAAELLVAHRGDPVFAATLLHGIGPAGVAEALHRADRRWVESRHVDRSLVHGLAAALAVAMRVGIAPFGWPELVRASRRHPTGSRAVGLLLTAPAVFPTAALVAAARDLVVPWNRAARGDPGSGSSAWRIPGPRGGLDVRAVVLGRIAEDPAAARTVVATTDLDDLLAADLGYADRGLALAEVLVAGTAPTDPAGGGVAASPLTTGQRPAWTTAAANLAKVVDWMARSGPVPVGVEMAVGRLLGPWIGSVRSAGLDTHVTRHALLDEGAARRVLAIGMTFEGVRDELRAAAWSWAATETRRLAARPVVGTGFDAVGSVVGIVSVEEQNARARTAVRRDVERHRQRSLWSSVQGLVGKPLPRLAGTVVGVVGGPIRDRFLPDTDLELEHWREHRDHDLGHEALAFEYLVAAALWNRREGNGYFETAGGDPPPTLTVDRAGGPALRPLVALDGAGTADYLAWRSRLADGRPAPIQLAVERFLAEGREATAPLEPPARGD